MEKKDIIKFLGAGLVAGMLFIPGNALAAGNGLLRIGDRGSDVTQIQQALKQQGFYTYSQITGYYGTITQKAVVDFQKKHKLWPDGVAGPVTRKALLGGNYTPTVSSSSSTAGQEYKPDSLRQGSEGSEVTKLQTRLKSLGYYTYSRITSFYGPITETAVRKFQSTNHLAVDGIAGKNTLGKVYSSSAVKAGKSTSTTSSSKSSTSTTVNRSTEGRATASKVIAVAKQYLGRPYVYGANGPSAFDCTGFTTYVYRQFGISLPRSAQSQGYGNYGVKVSRSQLMPGDLVFFNTIGDGDLSDHAGIYIGGGQFIHASSSRTNGRYVRISSLDSGYYKKVFSWGRRVIR